jgi:hypothetical protein
MGKDSTKRIKNKANAPTCAQKERIDSTLPLFDAFILFPLYHKGVNLQRRDL